MTLKEYCDAKKTYVIAEPGSTHEGHLLYMIQMIEYAARAGANAIKFQWTSSAAKLAQRRNAAEYESSYRLIQFPSKWLPILCGVCHEQQIDFACTVYLPEDVEVIARFVHWFKISSFEAGDLALWEKVLACKKPILVSTGARTQKEIQGLKHEYEQLARSNLVDVYWLHCISAYPCWPHDLQLHLLRTGEYHGFSDHSHHELTGAIAVAAGAQIIECHMTHPGVDATTNKDWLVSHSREAFTQYVQNIRVAEEMLWPMIAVTQGRVLVEAEIPYRRYQVPRTDHDIPSLL